MGKKSCIFGGAFDPVHNGHLRVVKICREKFSLDQVLWAPTYHSPINKTCQEPFEIRVKLLNLALRKIPEYKLTDIEKHLGQPSYTINTIKALKRKNPDINEWFLLIGEDNLNEFNQWHQPGSILKEVKLVVYPRGSSTPQPNPPPHTLLKAPLYPIHSTAIREKLSARTPIDSSWLPPKVSDFIAKHKLYI